MGERNSGTRLCKSYNFYACYILKCVCFLNFGNLILIEYFQARLEEELQSQTQEATSSGTEVDERVWLREECLENDVVMK